MPQLNSAIDRDLQKPTSYPHADAVNVSPEIAERRADLGKDASLGQLQAFDGPAPETINGKGRGSLVASTISEVIGSPASSMNNAPGVSSMCEARTARWISMSCGQCTHLESWCICTT
jgi:hypothetical protein